MIVMMELIPSECSFDFQVALMAELIANEFCNF